MDLIVLWFVGFLIPDNRLDLLRHWFLLLAPYGGTLRHIAAEIAPLAFVVGVDFGVYLPREIDTYAKRLLTNNSPLSVSTWIKTRSAVCLWLLWLVTA